MNNIFLTGRVKSGKSTVLRKVLAELKPCRIGGFFTEAVIENSQTVGYQIRSVSNQSMIFARANSQGEYQIGGFGIFPEVFESLGVRILESALESSQLILMDEIGVMEVGAPKFKESILRCLNSNIVVSGAIKYKSNTFLDTIRNRPDLELLYVNESNRDSLPQLVIKQIRSAIPSCIAKSV